MLLDLSNAPEDILLEIFKRLPAKDAIRCSTVCKKWANIVNSYGFWTQKCKYDNYLCDTESIQQFHHVPIRFLKMLIAKKAFNRNLLDDDYSLEDPKIDARWSDFRSNRQRPNVFEVQAPADFYDNTNRVFQLDECPEPFTSCLVSSHGRANRFLYVDLAAYGLNSEVLNLLKPSIVIQEYHTNRKDCGCRYSIGSILLEREDVVRGGTPGRLPGWKISEDNINQWTDEYWRKAEHVWNEYEDDKTIACISVNGSDSQFWAGNYGVKIAGTSLIVKLEFNAAN